MKRLRILKYVLLAVMIVLVYLFVGAMVSYGRHPEITETTKQNTDITRFYKKSDNQERASVIEKNGDALLQRIRLIKNAKKEIILSTFAFHADNSGRIVIGALLEAAGRGVKVKVLADGFESWIAMERNPYFYALAAHENIEVKLYNRANPLKPWKIMGRMHDKYLIADREAYILGGRNTYDFFLGDFPGHKNIDRDAFVYCENPQPENSVYQLLDYFESVWNRKESRLFHDDPKLNQRSKVKKSLEDAKKCYRDFYQEHEEEILDTNYEKDTLPTEGIALVSNPIHTGAKEPTAWYELGELMKQASSRVKIHTPYIICNDYMYGTWKEISEKVPDFMVMTNSVTNNGNAFGAADLKYRKEEMLDTGIDIWEYEGGTSYHGKSILIDDDISVIGSFNMDMRSAYLDTELMLVIRSEEVNDQLEAEMLAYEKSSRQALPDGAYNNPYEVEPASYAKGMKRRVTLVGRLLGWARFLF